MPGRHRIFTPWHLLMLTFMIGTVAGTAMANAAVLQNAGGADTGGSMISENCQAFLAAAAGGSGAHETVFVIIRRLLEVSLLWAAGLTAQGILGFAAVSLYLGLSSAMILCSLTAGMGAAGIFIYLAALFPHGLIYIPVFLILARWALSREKRLHGAAFFLLLAAAALGGALESLVNPGILGLLL